MFLKPIKFNKIFNVINKEDEFFISERKDQKNFPIFDLSKDSWCLIRWNTSNHMLFLFYKEKDCEFYTSSIRSHPATKEGIFVEFKKVETGSFEEKWMKKI